MRHHVLIDIDHTLANSAWRDYLIDGPGGWDEYHAASESDLPLHDMVGLVNALKAGGYHVTGITARPAKWRALTMKWLMLHRCELDELLMRPDDAFHPAPELKLRLALMRYPNLKEEIAFVLDDREDVIATFKAQGVTALQVHGRVR